MNEFSKFMKMVGVITNKLAERECELSPEKELKMIDAFDSLERIRKNDEELQITVEKDGLSAVLILEDLEYSAFGAQNKEELLNAMKQADVVSFGAMADGRVRLYLEFKTIPFFE